MLVSRKPVGVLVIKDVGKVSGACSRIPYPAKYHATNNCGFCHATNNNGTSLWNRWSRAVDL